jgi:uncharacterized membrane protein
VEATVKKNIYYIIPGAIIGFLLFISCGMNPSTSNTSDTDNMIVGTWSTQGGYDAAVYVFNSDGSYSFTPYSTMGSASTITGTYSTVQSAGTLALVPLVSGNQVPSGTYNYTISSDNNTLTIYYSGVNGDPTNYSRQ